MNGLTSSANPRSYHLGATRGTAQHTTSFRVGWSLSDVTTAPSVRKGRRQHGEVMSVRVIYKSLLTMKMVGRVANSEYYYDGELGRG